MKCFTRMTLPNIEGEKLSLKPFMSSPQQLSPMAMLPGEDRAVRSQMAMGCLLDKKMVKVKNKMKPAPWARRVCTFNGKARGPQVSSQIDLRVSSARILTESLGSILGVQRKTLQSMFTYKSTCHS